MYSLVCDVPWTIGADTIVCDGEAFNVLESGVLTAADALPIAGAILLMFAVAWAFKSLSNFLRNR